jgi:hypothetical protein
MQTVPRFRLRERTDIDIGLERISCALCAHCGDETFDEAIVHARLDDEALRRNAALTRVDEPALDAARNRKVEIRVREDYVWIAAAELEHSLLERAAAAAIVRPAPLFIDRVMNGVSRPFFGWLRIGREQTMSSRRSNILYGTRGHEQ